MVPIYEQVSSQIRNLIIRGELKDGEILPSVRTMAAELKISSLTVKKSYDLLEEEGFVTTVHGKGVLKNISSEMFLESEVFFCVVVADIFHDLLQLVVIFRKSSLLDIFRQQATQNSAEVFMSGIRNEAS